MRQPRVPRHRRRRPRRCSSRCGPATARLALRDVVQRAIDGDPGCARVIADAGSIDRRGRRRGLAIAVNPQCIVVGGELAETGELLLGPLREAIRQRVLLNQIAPLEVVPAELGQRAEVVGALELVLRSTDFVVRSDEQARAAGTSCAGEQEVAH